MGSFLLLIEFPTFFISSGYGLTVSKVADMRSRTSEPEQHLQDTEEDDHTYQDHHRDRSKRFLDGDAVSLYRRLEPEDKE